MNVLCIIPARSGSKGIINKNIRKLSDKPLIYYSINSAKKSNLIDKIIVSTDDEKIIKISKKYGAEIPFKRPKKFATDCATTFDVVKHAIEFLEKNQAYHPEIVIILQPTSPLRTTKIIDDSIKKLIKSKASSVISVAKIKKHPFSAFWLKNNELKPFHKNFKKFDRRQKYPDLFFPSGSVYVFWSENIKKYNSIYGSKIKHIFDKDDLDIDEPLDFFFTEMIMKNWKNYKRKFSNLK